MGHLQAEASFTERNGFGQRHHRIGQRCPRASSPTTASEIVDTTDEWIVPRTGIHTRHVAIEETCTTWGPAALRALGLRRRLAARGGRSKPPAWT
ncbi:MAG: hypothetical protein ACLUE1_09630 [Adlercreutzia equolifaciens]